MIASGPSFRASSGEDIAPPTITPAAVIAATAEVVSALLCFFFFFFLFSNSFMSLSRWNKTSVSSSVHMKNTERS